VPESIGLAYVSQHVALVRLKRGVILPEWIAYLALSSVGKTYLEAQGYGGTKVQLSLEDIARLPIVCPPLSEQVAIVSFLDRETAKIDALVEAQQRLIELLREKRQAIIAHAVTKGLDSSAPTKNSDADWLGSIPSHWRVLPLKRVVVTVSGSTPNKDRRDFWSGEIPWASAKDLKKDSISDTQDHISKTAIDESGAAIAKAGSVLVLVRGMMLARLFPVTTTLVPMSFNQDLKALSGVDGMLDEYLPWLLRGMERETLNRLDEAGHGTKALRMGAWLSMAVPVPPEDEQREIVRALGEQLDRIDSLVVGASAAASLLQERRAALISAAVTGKIDVREASARDAEAA